MGIRLNDAFVQAVRDALDLVDLASEHTALSKKGNRFQGLCPFHKEKTPSFSVDAEEGLYYCFGCGAGGDAIGFHMQVTGDDFPSAMEALALRYGVPLPEGGQQDQSAGRLDQQALELAERFFAHHLRQSPSASSYLERRSIASGLVSDFRIGFAPDEWQELHDSLASRVPDQALEEAGLVARSREGRLYDRFRNRLMFPIRTAAGRLVGFGGRTLGEDRAKYINTRETGAFQKGQILYGLDRARPQIREHNKVLLVEGYFDLLAAVASGIDWVVASMGTALTLQQARLLKRYADEVVIGYDGDRAGEEASRKALKLLLGQGLFVRRARFPAGQDPDSLRLEEGADVLQEVVASAPDAVERELERVPRGVEDRPQLQAEWASELRDLLEAVPDAVLRYGYGRQAAQRLGVPEELLRNLPGSKQPAASQSAPRSDAVSPALVTSLEERTLQILLPQEVSKVSTLPDPEIFFDQACREIFGAYRELAGDTGAGSRVELARLLSRLDRNEATIDRVARLLLQEPSGMEVGELQANFEQLDRRWKHKRSKQLRRELLEAQRSGDDERLHQLLEQKAKLSRDLHRGS